MNNKTKKTPDHWFVGSLKSLIPTDKPIWLSWASIIFSLWLILYPEPREPLFILVISLPLVGLIINRRYFPNFESLLLVKKEFKKQYYHVAHFIFFPAVALFIRCLTYHSGSYFKIFEIGTIGFALILAIVFALYGFIEKTNTDRLWIYLFIIPAIALYTYSTVYVINCEFDNSAPIVFYTKITAKYSQTGKNSGYFLTVDGWEKYNGSDDVKVSFSKYNSLQIGAQIKVEYQKGLLNIPWYYYDVE